MSIRLRVGSALVALSASSIGCDERAGSAASGSAQRAAQKPPILIGITADASGQYASSGDSDKRGVIMAIEEVNASGGVLGRPVKWVHLDTETTPATGSRVAERLIKQNRVAFIVGGVSSGVANAISQVAQKYGVIYLNTNSSSATEAGENCHRVKFVWDANGSNFSRASTKGAIEAFGKKWLLLTNDYVWGHDTAKATRRMVEASGGEIIGELAVPQGTRDFSAILLKVQQKAPHVIATAVGGDDLKALRAQVAQLELGHKFAWINNQQDWPDIYGLPRSELFGVFGTTWYQGLQLPGVPEFNARYAKANPDAEIKTPGNVFYNGYFATHALLGAIKRVNTTQNHAVIKELERLRIPAQERMQHHDAYMNPATHQLQQTIYLATANLTAQSPDDLFQILSYTEPRLVIDEEADSKCKLEPFESTPVYEP